MRSKSSLVGIGVNVNFNIFIVSNNVYRQFNNELQIYPFVHAINYACLYVNKKYIILSNELMTTMVHSLSNRSPLSGASEAGQ